MSKNKKNNQAESNPYIMTVAEYENRYNLGSSNNGGIMTAADYDARYNQYLKNEKEKQRKRQSSWNNYVQKTQMQFQNVQNPKYYYDVQKLNLNISDPKTNPVGQTTRPEDVTVRQPSVTVRPASDNSGGTSGGGGGNSGRYDPSKLTASAGVSDTRSGRTSGGGGKPGQTGLSAQEKGKWINKTISELQRQYDAAMQQSMTIDRYKNPQGAMKAQRDAEDLRRRIEENKKLLEKNNAEIEQQKTAQRETEQTSAGMIQREPLELPLQMQVNRAEDEIARLKDEYQLSMQNAMSIDKTKKPAQAMAAQRKADELKAEIDQKSQQVDAWNNDINEKLKKSKQQDPLKDYVGSSYTYGGDERPPTLQEMYEATDPKLRGTFAGTALDYENWQKYNSMYGMDTYKGLEEKKNYFQNVLDSTDELLRQIAEDPNGTINGIELISDRDLMLYDLIQEHPELISNPIHSEENNRKVYDFYSGEQGVYDLEKDDPERESRLAQFWEDIDSGYAGTLAQQLYNVEDTRGKYEYISALNREAKRQLNEIKVLEDKKEKYNEIVNKYDDVLGTVPADYVPVDRGGNAYNSMADFERGVQTNDVHRIYSFVSGGNEFNSWAEMIQQFGKKPRVTEEYSYAMMLKDGSDGGANEIKIFEDLYKKAISEGREPTEAMEFLNALQPYLHQRYNEAQEISVAEAARQYPVLASAASVMMHQANTWLYLPRKVAEIFGDQSVKDKFSAWYAPTNQADKIESTIAGDLGGVAGKVYLNIMNSINNLTRGLMTSGMGGITQQVVALGSMFAQVAQESTARNLEKYDYETASKFGAIDGMFEVLQEFLPFETMLGSAGAKAWKAILSNMISEFGQEFSGASWMKILEGVLKGDREDVARADEIIAQKGFYNADGQWVDLSGVKDTNVLVTAAKIQASREMWKEAWESGFAGLFGGTLSASYGGITNTINTVNVGKTINNPQNIVDGLTGAEQIVKTAVGLEGTKSQVMGQKIEAKMQKGKKPSNYEIGKLAATMAEETNDQVNNVVQDTVMRRVMGQLKEAGISGNNLRQIAGAITRGLTGDKMTKEDREIIARDARAIDLWKSYNSFTSEDYAGLREDVEKATEPMRSVANLIGDLTGKYAKATGAVADEIDEVNRTAKTVDEAIDTLAERNSGLISEGYAAIAKQEAGAEGNKNHQKTFLNDAVQIRLAAFSLNRTMPKTNIDQESAQRLWEAAQQEFREEDAKRIKNQAAIVPGKGNISYEGEAYGSDGWKQKLSGLKGPVRQQVAAIAYIANRLGHTVRFEYNDKVFRENGKAVGSEQFVHGYETGSGAIVINVAGMLASGARKNMMVTIAHEMTHWLEQNSAEGYAALRDFLLANLRAKGMNVEQRMIDLMNNQRSVLKGTGEDDMTLNKAMAEIVAQSCEELLSSEELINRLEKENPGLHAKIKSFLRNLISKLTGGAEDSLSQEARLLRDIKEDIAKMWFTARDEALNRKADGEEAGEGVSFSVATALEQDLEDFDGTETAYGNHKSFSVVVTDKKTLDFLNNQDTVTTYRSMQLIDGKLYPPMAAKIGKNFEDATELGKWEQAVEHPERIKIDKKGKTKFSLNKGNGKALDAAYNPYMHSSNLMLNDQFSSAYDRPNLVTVECEVPVSEIDSGYHAQYAKDSVGWHNWHTGPVSSDLRKETGTERRVFLSRWIKPVRIVPNEEVARHYAELLKGTDIAVPDTVVTPALKNELIKAGVNVEITGEANADEEDNVSYSVVQLTDGTKIAVEDENILKNKPEGVSRLKYISDYLKEHIGEKEFVKATSDVIYLGKALPGEYVASDYTKALIKGHSNNLEVKNRAAGFLLDAIAAADSKTGPETVKHQNKNAKYGVYRFTTRIAIPVKNRKGEIKNYNVYKVQLLVNYTGQRNLELYDMIDITKDNTAGDVLKKESANGSLKVIRYPAVVSDNNLTQREKKNKAIMDRWEEMKKNSSFSVAQMDQDYEAARNNGDTAEIQRIVNEAAERAMPDSKVRDEDGNLLRVYHGTNERFTKFDISKGRTTMDIQGAFFSPYDIEAGGYGENVGEYYLNITNPAPEGVAYAALNRFKGQNNAGIKAREYLIRHGYDGVQNYDEYIAFYPEQIKSADAETYDDDGNVIPPSVRFDPNEGDIRYSVAQLAQANGFRFDEDAVQLYDKEDRLIDGVKVKVTEAMIEKTPMGMLINMARDGVTTKGGKVKFKSTISAETAKAQKKMFADLMNMVARYKDSNLVWEIAGSTLYSALKGNSDPQYKTTVDYGTVCAKTQEIINVMSRVMLEKGRGLTREEVLMVYNETANAGLTVPCPVCYVFSRWMGVPSLLNSISQYQKRFVKLNPDGTINKKATQAAATKYINDAMKKYGSKAALDKAKTSITNRMKTQEKNRTDALVVANSKTATAEEKQAAKIKHDKAIKELDALTKDMAEVEAYNWVTQALCKETSKGSGKYVLDPEFELTPDNILFDLRRTGDFAKFTKNWRYRNTRGAGMGKAIMPYSGMSIGDIIYGTERKTELKNTFLQMKAGGASNAMKNAIIRARKQNLVGGQRLQSTSDFRPEWGLDYLMSFLELQAIGSKVQMYTKVAEAVDLLASMQADVNLSIMGAGSGYHLATAAEIREAQKNTKRGQDLRSRMGTTTDENGKMQTYILDFSDVTGMDYDTAKALKNRHNSVQMILVGMNDIHIRLAMANPDIDFIIPWHSSGNTQDALASMISSVGEKLETSSDYQDTQSDKPAENQTAEQKQLWDLRMKILQGKSITAAEKKIIDGDDWLSGLWERFNVEGVDEDCYQVELDADQAGQIFPYEYWDKGLTKAKANGNGLRFIEYCQHFGITPRFSGVVKTNEDGTFTVTGNFAGAIYDDQGNITGYDPKKMTNGYWKALIDRPMYDNKGRYRDQQVVDVTKAKVGSLDAKGRLQNSDMPLKTSAMYGDGYSEQEKNATDNTLAALDMKAKLEAIGENVLNGIQPVRPNQSAFGASAGVPTMNTQAVSEQEVIAPKKQKARYVDEESRSFSVVQPDMEVSTFMLGLNENSLSTAQEKIMLRQFKEIRKTMEVAQMALEKRTASLRELEKKENPTAYDREEMRKLRNQITNWQNKYDRSVAQLTRITNGKGYAKLMQQQEKMMRDLVSGRTYEEVRKTVEALTKMMQDVTKEIDAREKKIGDLRDDLAYKKTATLINRPAVEKIASMIRETYGATMSKADLVRELTTIRLKMARKMDIEDDVMNLAWRIAESTAADGGESLRSLRGTTITLGAGQVKELLGTDGSLKELRSIFAGTGIQIRTAKEGKTGLDADWQQLCDAVPELDRNAKELEQVNELIRFVRNQKAQMTNAGMFKGNMEEFEEDLKAMAATIGMNAPSDPAAMKILNEMSKLVDSMAAGVQTSAEELRKARRQIAGLVNQGMLAMSQQDAMQYDIEQAIKYNNALTEQSEAELWKSERRKLIDQLSSETTEKLIAEQQKWKERIARDKTARDMMQSNMQLRKSIHTNVTRLRKLLVNETDLKNIPEHMKSLTREMLGMIVRNDLTGRKLTGIAKQDLIELDRILGIMKEQDGEFTLDDLRLITDEEAQSVVEDALADIEDGIRFYNASSSGGILTTLQGMHNALDRISEAVSTITSVIHAEQSISIGERRVLVADAAEEVAYDMRGSRFKGETRGRGSRQINMARKAVLWGNLTPVYFFRNLKNRGMMKQWKELTSAENRNGLELQKAAARIREIADKANYKEWTGQTHKVKFGGRTFDITIDQMMSLYAIWKREKELNPQMSNHMQQGGVIFDKEESTTGKLRKETTETRPVKISDADVQAMYDMLTEEQKTYLDEIVSYLSNDMSELGNEASMKMYGIKKYKEKWYFPMQVWDGVKSARSDRGISGTNENRAAHKSWSKRRINKASNALIIGDFTQIAVGHIVEMINYNTVAPAIENINKILNYQRNEQAEPGNPESGVVKRNIRVMFQQAYGQQALNYLETFLQDLNGGTVQDQRKTLREAALSMFKKNAVAGSLSVALQQPLSYIRAAMMINPMYLARALNPIYWKGSQAEMMKYSGVAVIKAMGRFDMNFGRSAKDFVAPDKPEGIYSRISDKLTAAPELMDTMTWTRMWSAVKIEQHKAHPEMDITSDEFLKIVAERFNEVMQRTQVYDSVMVKSQNMRSNNYAMKIVTSFMAEPTLSLNVMADAVQGAITKTEGWKKTLMSAGATFALSAAAQAFVKGLMGSGRTPDEKKTWLENFLYKWYSAFLGEVNPLGLIPGYSDIIELIKNGELNDDAMGAIGKIFTTIDTASKAIQGKGKGWYRDLEDTAAQLAQLFSNVPAKNIMRDLRAMFNWISQEPYAKRETSSAVLRQQTKAAFWNADSLIGAINAKLGEAGYQTSNKSYYGRMFDAMQRGNQAEADDIREYMMLAKGTEEKDITSGLKTAAKDRLDTVEADEWMISNDMMDSTSTMTTQYNEGKISRDEYKRLLKKQNPKLTDNDIWWMIDLADYKKETGNKKASGYGYRLKDAIDANNTEKIRKAIQDMTKHGLTNEKIKSDYLSDWKSEYLNGSSDRRRKIRDALQKAYKILGYTAEDANKTIERWEKEAKKKKN